MTQIPSRRRPPLVALAGLVGLALLFSACASIDPQPFEKFSESAQRVRDSVKMPLEAMLEETRERELGEIVADPLKLSGLRLSFADPTFEWTYPQGDKALLFTTLAARDKAAENLNQAFAGYAGLLASLASEKILPQDQFDQQVKDINSNARAALSGVGVSGGEEETDLLSLGVVELFKVFADAKRKHRLKAALEANQDVVGSFATKGANLMVDSASDISSEYLFHYGDLQESFVAADAAARAPILQQILALNQQTTSALNVVGGLYSLYRTLPLAHRQLTASLDAKRPVLTEIEDLYGQAAHLEALYKGLKQSPGDPSQDPPQP